jgi:hypothetical protein
MTKQTISLFSKTEPIIENYRHHPIPLQYLDDIYDQFLTPTFGQLLLPRQTIAEIGRVNPNSFLFITNSQSQIEALGSATGVFALIPLLPFASQQMRTGQLMGLQLRPEHVAPVSESASSAYLAMGIALTSNKRKRVASIVYTSILLLDFDLVFSLPMSAEGLAVNRRFGFVPVDPQQPFQVGVLQEWRNPFQKLEIKES